MKDEPTSIQERVFEYVARERMAKRKKLDRDLTLYGDDVDEFFLGFLTEFQVPLDGLDLTGCFPGEGFALFIPLHWGFRPSRRVRIRHLVEAATTGRRPSFDELGNQSHDGVGHPRSPDPLRFTTRLCPAVQPPGRAAPAWDNLLAPPLAATGQVRPPRRRSQPACRAEWVRRSSSQA